MHNVLIIVFSYNRPKMLSNLLKELKGHYVLVIDDGSVDRLTIYEREEIPLIVNWIDTPHEGKRGFWMKWVLARQLALGAKEFDYFLFIPDDASNVRLDAIKQLTEQGWDDQLFAINVLNCGRKECWGAFKTGQKDFKIGDTKYQERGFVDCALFTNRKTLSTIRINQTPDEWFNREDKSSGVGANMTTQLRLLNAPMMMATPTIVSHGTHASVMHPEHRKQTILKT